MNKIKRFESPIREEILKEQQKEKISLKILKRRSQLLPLFIIIFIILGIAIYNDFKFGKTFFELSIWLISFNIALMLVLAISKIPEKMSKQEKAKIKFFLKIRKESFDREISLLKSEKTKEAKKEFDKQSDIYNILSMIENKFILSIVLSTLLSIFYIISYLFILNQELINKFFQIPSIGTFPIANIILIITFFTALWNFIRAFYYLACVFADS